jgi:hypothetical protein
MVKRKSHGNSVDDIDEFFASQDFLLGTLHQNRYENFRAPSAKRFRPRPVSSSNNQNENSDSHKSSVIRLREHQGTGFESGCSLEDPSTSHSSKSNASMAPPPGGADLFKGLRFCKY